MLTSARINMLKQRTDAQVVVVAVIAMKKNHRAEMNKYENKTLIHLRKMGQLEEHPAPVRFANALQSGYPAEGIIQ